MIFAYLLLKLFFRKEFKKELKNISPQLIIDKKLAMLSKISLVIIFILVTLKIVLISFHLKFDFKLTDIAVVAALPIVLLDSRRFEILKRIDWHTLVFLQPCSS